MRSFLWTSRAGLVEKPIVPTNCLAVALESAPASAALPASHRSFISNSAPKCTLVEEKRTSVGGDPGQEKKLTSPYYRVLPANIPQDSLPPPPPVHRSLPWFGFLIESALEMSSNWSRARVYGGIYFSNFLSHGTVYVTKMEAIVDMMKDPDTFRNKDSFKPFGRIFGEDCIALIDGEAHAKSRGALAPAFSPGLFPFYFNSIRSRVESTWARVEESMKQTGSRRLLLDPVFREHYLSVAVEMTTGISMDSEGASKIRDKFHALERTFFSPPFGPVWTKGMEAKADLLKIVENVVRMDLVEKAGIIERLRSYGDKLSFLGSKDIAKGEAVNVLLIATAKSDLKTGQGQANDPELIASLGRLGLLLFFGAYATSAATSSSAAFEMGMDPSIWDQLAAEQDKIVADSGSTTVTFQQTCSEMPLLDSYILEILRIRPAAVGNYRKLSKNVEALGHHVKEGSTIFMDFCAAMRDERLYPDPDTLKVDRFLKQPGKTPPARVLSFGAPGSPHYCIGEALSKVLIKITFAVLLREYNCAMDPKQSRKYSVIPEYHPASKVIVQKFERRR